jgi:hypothetical protein
MNYKIVRYYFNRTINSRVIIRNLTLEEAKRWCNDPESSSSTCTKSVGKARTRKIGNWFDAYQKQ